MSDALYQSIPAEMRREIELFVEHAVDQRLLELLGDPDEGLEIREDLAQRLREQQLRVAAGARGQSMKEVFSQLGGPHEHCR
jgi:hypothetical protein